MENKPQHDDLISDRIEKLELLAKYVDSQATAEEREKVEKWLGEDPLLYSTFNMMREDADESASTIDPQAAARAIGLSADDILKAIKKSKANSNNKKIPSPKPEILPMPPPLEPPRWWSNWRYQLVAAASFFMMAFGGLRGYVYMTVNRPVGLAVQSLQESYRNYIDDARLSGGYAETGLGITMSPKLLFEEEEEQLKGALSHDPNNEIALRKLALIYAARSQHDKRDSVIAALKSRKSLSAESLNDLGVYAYRNENWHLAGQYFEQAMLLENAPPEAQYNLALCLEKTGQLEEARELLEVYLRSESRPGWRRATERILNRIREEESQ